MRNLLIGYPENFGNYEYFYKKVGKLTSNMQDYDVISLKDHKGFIEKYFGNRISLKIQNKLSHREIIDLLSSCSHIILFWDGTELNDYIYYSMLLKKDNRILPVVTTKVVNKDKTDDFDVYIGRGSPWGNPYAIGNNNMTREDVIEKYRIYFKENFIDNPDNRETLFALKGKKLGCHCKPLACHGDVIAEYLNSLDQELSDTDIYEKYNSNIKQQSLC